MDNRFQESRQIGRIPTQHRFLILFVLGIELKLCVIDSALKAYMRQAAHTKIPRVKRPTTRVLDHLNTLSADSADQRL